MTTRARASDQTLLILPFVADAGVAEFDVALRHGSPPLGHIRHRDETARQPSRRLRAPRSRTGGAVLVHSSSGTSVGDLAQPLTTSQTAKSRKARPGGLQEATSSRGGSGSGLSSVKHWRNDKAAALFVSVFDCRTAYFALTKPHSISAYWTVNGGRGSSQRRNG